MKIAYNPLGSGVYIPTSNYENDIIFDLVGRVIYAKGIPFDGTKYSTFKKHTSLDDTGGSEGLVPAPSYSSFNTRFLREDGQWINIAETSPPDSELNLESENSVLNKVITKKINEIIQSKASDVYKNIKIGQETLIASGNNDTLEFIGDTGILLFPNSINKSITISTNIVGSQGISITSDSGKLTVKVEDTYYNRWNSVYGWYESITKTDTDDIINKWQEIVDFLKNIEDTSTLAGILTNFVNDLEVTGSGNAITNISKSGSKITAKKENTFWKVNELTSVGTGDIYLEMWRGANASWKMINTEGILKFLCNYTSTAGSYYDVLTVAYNTGNVLARGSITSATGIHNSTTTLYLDSAATTTSIIFRHGTTERMRIALPNGYVGIGTDSPKYPLHVSGDSYTIGWSRAGNGFYVEDTGVHYMVNSNSPTVGLFYEANNNEFNICTNYSNTNFYFNYRAPSYGKAVTSYTWNAGNSTSYASHTMGVLQTYGTITSTCGWPNIVCNNNNSGAIESNIRFEVGGTNKGYVGFANGYGTYLYNSSAGKYVYIHDNGYFYTQSYIHVGAGNEKNASSPPYVWGVNGSDNFMRTYATSSLSVGNANYAISAPAAANYGGTGSTTKIKVKINSTKSWMLSFVVTIYQGYKSSKIMVSGYNYGTNYWYEPEAVLLGDSNGATSIPVYFGYDSAWNLWIGFDGGSYTGVSISDVTNGYTQISLKELFTISNVSSLSTIQKTVTAVNSVNYAATANSANYTTRLYANSTSNLTTKPGEYSLAYSRFLSNASNIFPVSNNANGVITAHLHSGEYYALIGLSSNGRMYYRTMMALRLDSEVAWKTIAFTSDLNFIPANSNMVHGTYGTIPTYNGETGWHRIATINSNYGYGSHILYLCGSWSYASNTNAILHIDTMHTTAKITLVSGYKGFISDVRLVNVSNNLYYVDVYINYSGANTPGTVYFYFLGNGTVTANTTAQKITTSVTASAQLTLVTGTKTNDSSYAAHFYENSDIMLKTNIKPISNSDNMPILKEFNWKKDGTHGYGLIAQELEAMGYSELVDGEDGTKTVNYSAALSLIVGKLQVKIRELEKEIEILKNKN